MQRQEITPFKFLTLKQLQDNAANLKAKVEAQEEKTHDQLNEARKAQIKLLEEIYAELERMTAGKTIEDLEGLYADLQDGKVIELFNLTQKENFTKEDELREEHLHREIKNLGLLISNLMETRKLEDKNLSDEQKSKIATGRFLDIQKQIEVEFSNRWFNKLRSSLDNCVLYTGIPEAIGVTAGNQLSPASKKEALGAYSQFMGMNELIAKLDDIEANVDARAQVPAKHKLKHLVLPSKTNTLVAPTGAELLLPPSKLRKLAEDKHNKVRENAVAELAQYTPAEEIYRYERDIKGASYDSYQAIRNRLDIMTIDKPKEYPADNVRPSETANGRNAKDEEYIKYTIAEGSKNYKDSMKVKENDPRLPELTKWKEQAKVLTDWKGEYNKEGVEKVRQNWRGRRNHETTADVENFFRESIKEKLEVPNLDSKKTNVLKHHNLKNVAKTAVADDVVDEEINSKAKPIEATKKISEAAKISLFRFKSQPIVKPTEPVVNVEETNAVTMKK